MPTGTPGYGLTMPDTSGTPPLQDTGINWRDLLVPPLLRPFVGLLDNLTFKNASDILGNNLEAAGTERPEGSAAHHIVPYGDRRAQSVRDQLDNLGIDINSADNGVFLPQVPGSTAPGAYHPSLNSDAYNKQLQLDFLGVNSRNEALDVLDKIRNQLLNGTYPSSKPVPPKP